MTNPDPMAEIRASFFIECEELLEAMQDGLQTMDDGAHDSETINVVFRAVHSIKGGAGAFGLEPLVRFAHRYETVMDQVRSETLAITPDLLKLFFRAADHLSDLVRLCRDDLDIPQATGDAILAELDIHAGESSIQEEDEDIDFQPLGLSLDLDFGDDDNTARTPCYRIAFTPKTEMFETGNDSVPILRALADLGDCTTICEAEHVPTLDALAPETPYLSWTVTLSTTANIDEIMSVFEFVDGLCTFEIEPIDDEMDSGGDAFPELPSIDLLPEPDEVDMPLPDLMPEPAELISGSEAENAVERPKKQKTERTPPASPNAVVRVDLNRIERLVNLVGELVINQAMLAQSIESSRLSPHSDAMRGLGEFQRLTRDIQDSVMMIRAQPVKSLFQRMSRIVREASAAVGKDVRLVTDGENTEIDKTVIERLADPLTHMIRNAVDHGLEDTDARIAAGKPSQGQVRLSAAHRSGRVVIEIKDDGGGINRSRVMQIAIDKGLVPADSKLSDSEIDNLLFLPGFSTAETVSDLSGRGVGMDVVRTAIQALSGRISISSTPSQGTTFSISLPLTLAVLDGMVVRVANETLVLPLNVVTETLTLRADNLDEIQPGLTVLRSRGSLIPLFDLGCHLGYRKPKETYVDDVALLITKEDGNIAALIVDEIQDQRQVVIKGLDDNFYRAPGIAAATILGDGQIALILDPSDIAAQAAKVATHTNTPQKLEA